MWEDRWIPDNTRGKVTTQKSQDCNLLKVELLINQKKWNRNLIHRNFNRKDVEKILSIPISLFDREEINF